MYRIRTNPLIIYAKLMVKRPHGFEMEWKPISSRQLLKINRDSFFHFQRIKCWQYRQEDFFQRSIWVLQNIVLKSAQEKTISHGNECNFVNGAEREMTDFELIR